MVFVTCLLLVSVVVGVSGANEFSVLDGERQATIVYPAELEKMDEASEELVSYLSKATGQEFSAVSEADFAAGPDAYPIYVGRCQTTEERFVEELGALDQDAFMVVVEPARIFLFGPTDYGTYFAVCDFLERHVGVRWLIPGPLGEDVPNHDRILVAPTRRTEVPGVLSRQWEGAGRAGGGEWMKRMRMRPRYHARHNLRTVFDADKYFDEHPEYFAEYGGKRSKSRPCLTEPGTIRVAAETAREAWDKDPNVESFSFGPEDGQSFCDCENCRPLKKYINFHGWRYNNNSYLYFGWLNKVAFELEKTHPDKLLGTLAYIGYVVPPPEMRFQPNIMPYICVTIGDSVFPRHRAANYELYASWGDKVNQIGIYEYAYGLGYGVPHIYTHVFQDEIQYAMKHNLQGYYGEAYPNYGLDGPRLYMMARILWNPDVDVDRLQEEWNERMFREAAAPMKKYFARCEQAWNEQSDPGKSDHRIWRQLNQAIQFRIFTPEIMRECTGYLDEAAAMATTDIVKDRIQFFRKTWDVTVFLGTDWWKGLRVHRLMAQDAPVREVTPWLRAASEWKTRKEYLEQAGKMIDRDWLALSPGWQWPPVGALAVPMIREPFESESTMPADSFSYWAASKTAREVIEDAVRTRRISGRAIRAEIERRIANDFGTRSPDAYNKIVDEVTTMAMKIAAAVAVQEPPTVDGNLSEELWEGAEVISSFTLWGEKSPAQSPTSVKMVHDGQSLYIAWECVQDTRRLSDTEVKRDGGVEVDDSVTLFLRPTSEDRPCLQVAFSPRPGTTSILPSSGTLSSASGHLGLRRGFLDAMFLPESIQPEYDYWTVKDEEAYSSPSVPDYQRPREARQGLSRYFEYYYDFVWATKVREDRWTAELKVPLQELGWGPGRHRTFRLNIVRRVRNAGDELSTWFAAPSDAGPEDIPNQGWLVLESGPGGRAGGR